MPALVYYGGYRSFLAGDDLACSTSVAIVVRLVQLGVVVALTVITASSFENLRLPGDDLTHVCEDLIQAIDGGEVEIDDTFGVDIDFKRNLLMDHSFEFAVAYIVSAYVSTILGLILEILIRKVSLKGTPVEQDRRSALRPLCFFKMIPFSVLRVFNMLFGIVIADILGERCTCSHTVTDKTEMCPNYYYYQGPLSFLIATHFLEAAFVGWFALCLVQRTVKQASSALMLTVEPETGWKVFCKCCCTLSACLTCCTYGGMESGAADFSEIGMLLSDIFSGNVDIVLSDMNLALRMLVQSQKNRQEQARIALIRRMIQDQDGKDEALMSSPGEDAGIRQMSHGRLEGKIVEWLNQRIFRQSKRSHRETNALDLTDHTETLPGDDGVKRQNAVVYQKQHDDSTQEPIFQPTLRALLSKESPHDALVIAEGARFIHLSNSIYEWKIGYSFGERVQRFLFWLQNKTLQSVDHTFLGVPVGAGIQLANYTKTKFLTSAGLVNENIDLVYFQFGWGVGKAPYCISLDHDWKSVVVVIRGTYSLEDVVTDLTIVPESMDSWGERCNFDGSNYYAHAGMLRCATWIYEDILSHGIIEKLLEEHPGYRLRLTGHSLGAGSAAILSFLLRDRYPTLRCHCFCPPGCTMSESMAEACKSYLTSYVFDHDIIPRTTLEAVEHLRGSLYEMVARVKVRKRDVMRASPEMDEDMLLHGRDRIPPSKYYDQVLAFYEHQETIRKKRKNRNIRLVPPGKIVHLVRTSEPIQLERTCCCSASQEVADGASGRSLENQTNYTARWAHKRDFDEIVLSSHMLSDHSAPKIMSELEAIARSYGLSSSFVVPDVVDSPVKASSLLTGSLEL